MKRRTQATIAIMTAVLALAIATLALVRLNFIRDDSGGEVLWNAHEAYFFQDGVYRGFRVSYLSYALDKYFNTSSPAEERVFIAVVHLTSSGTDRASVELGQSTGSIPDSFTPYNGHIYAQCPGAILCKWTGVSFVQATEEERQSLGGIDRLSRQDFVDINGWSKQSVGLGPGAHIAIRVDGNFTLSIQNHAASEREYPRFSIDAQYPGKPPERIWDSDHRARRVNMAEYDRLLHGH